MEFESELTHAGLDEKQRRLKGKKIISILSEFTDLSKCDVLDIGVGSGVITNEISKVCRTLIGADVYDERTIKEGYSFTKTDGAKLPFRSESFDIVISNFVLEHTPNQQMHVDEFHRVLKKGGVCYVATDNRYWLIDPHYKLPCITILPRRISNVYLRFVKNREWDIYPMNYFELKRLFKIFHKCSDMTTSIIKYPERYRLDLYPKIQFLTKIIPHNVLKILNPFLPTYIFVLEK